MTYRPPLSKVGAKPRGHLVLARPRRSRPFETVALGGVLNGTHRSGACTPRLEADRKSAPSSPAAGRGTILGPMEKHLDVKCHRALSTQPPRATNTKWRLWSSLRCAYIIYKVNNKVNTGGTGLQKWAVLSALAL